MLRTIKVITPTADYLAFARLGGDDFIVGRELARGVRVLDDEELPFTLETDFDLGLYPDGEMILWGPEGGEFEGDPRYPAAWSDYIPEDWSDYAEEDQARGFGFAWGGLHEQVAPQEMPYWLMCLILPGPISPGWIRPFIAVPWAPRERAVGPSHDADAPIEDKRLATLTDMLASDFESRSRALSHIERMAETRRKARADTLRHGEAAMEVAAGAEVAAAEKFAPSPPEVGGEGGYSAEQLTAMFQQQKKAAEVNESESESESMRAEVDA